MFPGLLVEAFARTSDLIDCVCAAVIVSMAPGDVHVTVKRFQSKWELNQSQSQ